MKKVIFNGFLVVIVLLGACQTPVDLDDDDLVPVGDIPSSVLDFINNQYGDYQIQEAESEDICGDQLVYEVELEDGPGPDIDLYFDQEWNFLFSAVEISQAELPATVRQEIDTYLDYFLEEDELEQFNYTDGEVRYKVELSHSSGENDLELIINQDGSLFCSDDDDEEDDDDNEEENYDDDAIDSSQIPDSILNFILENFAGYEIEEVEKEDLCEDEYYFEIELEDDGRDESKYLYFSLQWEFLFEMIEIEEDDLPANVVDTINEEYPDAEIEEDDVYQLIWPNGTIQYMVELDGASDSDLEIIFDEDGRIACIND